MRDAVLGSERPQRLPGHITEAYATELAPVFRTAFRQAVGASPR